MRWKQSDGSGLEETIWKFLERAILSDGNRHDALVYFGRRISRAALVEQVHLWGRVIKGMGLKEGDELLLFGPSLPEFIYIMLAADMTGVTANIPNLMVLPEGLGAMVGRSRVAFVFDGLEAGIRPILAREQFEHVVVISATRSMGYPLKALASPLNAIKRLGNRHRRKYMTADLAVRRFGCYDGPLEAEAVPGKTSFIFCSSGTSGLGGAAHQIGMSDASMHAMFRNALAFNMKGEPFLAGTSSYCPLPPFVCTGFFVLVLAPLYRGMTVHLDPRLSTRQLIRNILTIRPQTILMPGPFWVNMIDHIDALIQKGARPDLSFFRFPVMGGEGCTPQALRHINEVMEACGSPVALTSGYGLSETFSVATVDYAPNGFDKDYSRPVVSVGPPFPGVTVGIFDPDGRELGRGERGEVRIKTKSLTTGYIGDPEYTQAKLKDGWLHTEDYGELDERGNLFVYGRMAQHVLAPGGEIVYLFDLANLLREDPAVKNALVCRLETEGRPLVAHVVLEDNVPDTDVDEVIRRLDERVSAFLPAGLRLEGYRTERGQLRSNLVGKTDRGYYSRQLTGYRIIGKADEKLQAFA